MGDQVRFTTEERLTEKVGGGGAHMSEVYGYEPLWWPPVSGSSAAPETHLVSVLAALHFPKKYAFLGPFLSDFGKNFSSKLTNFGKICSQGLKFKKKKKKKKKICSVDPTFTKHVWHLPTKEKFSAPPPKSVSE